MMPRTQPVPLAWKLYWRMEGDASPTRWCRPLLFATREEAEQEMTRRKEWWPKHCAAHPQMNLPDVAEYVILPADQYPE